MLRSASAPAPKSQLTLTLMPVVAMPLAVNAQETTWQVRELRDGHVGQVEGVAFSPDGEWLASADNDGVLVVRALEGAQQPWRATGRNFTEVAWSDDGRQSGRSVACLLGQ